MIPYLVQLFPSHFGIPANVKVRFLMFDDATPQGRMCCTSIEAMWKSYLIKERKSGS